MYNPFDLELKKLIHDFVITLIIILVYLFHWCSSRDGSVTTKQLSNRVRIRIGTKFHHLLEKHYWKRFKFCQNFCFFRPFAGYIGKENSWHWKMYDKHNVNSVNKARLNLFFRNDTVSQGGYPLNKVKNFDVILLLLPCRKILTNKI